MDKQAIREKVAKLDFDREKAILFGVMNRLEIIKANDLLMAGHHEEAMRVYEITMPTLVEEVLLLHVWLKTNQESDLADYLTAKYVEMWDMAAKMASILQKIQYQKGAYGPDISKRAEAVYKICMDYLSETIDIIPF